MKYFKRLFFTVVLPFAMLTITLLSLRDIWWRGEADDSSFKIWKN